MMQASFVSASSSVVKTSLGPYDVFCGGAGPDQPLNDAGGYVNFIRLIREALIPHQNESLPAELQINLALQIKAKVEGRGGQFLRHCQFARAPFNPPAYVPEDSAKALQFIADSMRRQYAGELLLSLSEPCAVANKTSLSHPSGAGEQEQAPPGDGDRKLPALNVSASSTKPRGTMSEVMHSDASARNDAMKEQLLLPALPPDDSNGPAQPAPIIPPIPVPPLSGCGTFFKGEREKISKETGKFQYDKAMRREICTRWVNLDPKKWSAYRNKAAIDQERYEQQLREYQTAISKIVPVVSVDAAAIPNPPQPQLNKPKSPPSVFQLYFKDQKEKVMAATGKMVYDAGVGFERARRWAEILPDEQFMYQRQADQLREKYKNDVEEWKNFKRGTKRAAVLSIPVPAAKKVATNNAIAVRSAVTQARGTTGFDVFYRRESVTLRNTEPTLTLTERYHKVKREWDNLSPQDKNMYDQQAEKENIQRRKRRAATSLRHTPQQLEQEMGVANLDERAREAKTLVTVIVEDIIGIDSAVFDTKSSLEKANEFSRCVTAITDRLSAKHDRVKHLFSQFPPNNLVGFVKALLDKQCDIRRDGRSGRVDIGCHNTASSNIESIKQEGLLTKDDRDKRTVNPFRENGRRFGNGIYSANSPVHFFRRYGSTQLVLLRLKGKEVRCRPLGDEDFDSISVPTQTMLRTSAQCAPIAQFEMESVTQIGTPCPLLRAVLEYSLCLESLADVLLNTDSEAASRLLGYGAQASDMVQAFTAATSGRSTTSSVNAISSAAFPTRGTQVRTPIARTSKTTPPACLGQIEYCMPTTLVDTDGVAEESYELVTPAIPEEECVVCMNPLGSSVARLECGHHLHLGCLREAAKRKTACPMCRNPFQKKTPVGHMPSGTMITTRDPSRTCAGHAPGCLVISYRFLGGTQQSYHPNPGQRYFPTSRVAFVPLTKEGIRLVSRLQDAFRHGLTFAVGTSLSTGRSNVICWQSIHHKTNLSGGVHGFPDDEYLRNCNEALDALNVKSSGSDELFESPF